jgi:hypothetical protein
MAQINLHTTPEFEENLAKLMRERGIRSKSEAIRIAVREAANDSEPPRPIERDWSVVGWAKRASGGADTSNVLGELKELQAELDREIMEKIDRRIAEGEAKPK